MIRPQLAICTAVLWGMLLAPGVAPALAQPVELVRGCAVESIAVLRLSELAQAITRCEQVIDDATTARELRGQAFAQRGLLYAKRWTIMEAVRDANQGIADITEGLQLHSPETARRHHLLNIRGQLYLATGQVRKATEDFKAVLNEAPNNDSARAGMRKAGTLDGF